MNSQRGFIPLNISKVFADALIAKFSIAKKHSEFPPEPKPSGLASPRKPSTMWTSDRGKQHAQRTREGRWMTSEEKRTRSICSIIAKGIWAHPSKDPNRDTVWLEQFEVPRAQALALGAKIFEGEAKRAWNNAPLKLSPSMREIVIDKFAAFKNL